MINSSEQITNCVNGLKKLADMYEDNSVLGLLLCETASLINSSVETSLCHVEENEELELKKYLKTLHIPVSEVFVERDLGGYITVTVGISKIKRGCIFARDLAEIMDTYFEKAFCVSPDSRQVISLEGGFISFVQKPAFVTRCARSLRAKDLKKVSGDSYSILQRGVAKQYMCLFDGMGCGVQARLESENSIENLERFLMAGYSPETAFRLINERIYQSGNEHPLTADLCVIDRYTGSATIQKMGAPATFVKKKEGTCFYELSSLPLGAVSEAGPEKVSISLENGDYVIMLSDGVMDALPFANKEKYLTEFIDKITSKNPQKISDEIMEEALFYDSQVKDDMTVLVCAVWRN